jgi:hypothetical protein
MEIPVKGMTKPLFAVAITLSPISITNASVPAATLRPRPRAPAPG